jgi:hypothetical protein
MKDLKFRVPVNLDIEKVISDNRDDFYSQGLKKEKLYYICDALLSSRAQSRKVLNDKFNPKENFKLFTPLSSELLKIVVHDYNKYLEFLLQTKILLTDGTYEVGKKCKGYCFNTPYSGQRIKEIRMNSYTLKKAIRRAADKRKEEMNKQMRGKRYLEAWWLTGKLKIDLKAANLWIDKYEQDKVQEINSNTEISPIDRENAINNAIDTSEDFKCLAGAINAQKPYYCFSGLGQRFYNPISNLKKELRNFITYDGKQLVDVDLKNSQPFLSLALFNSSFWEGGNGEKLWLKKISKDIDKIIKDKGGYSYIIMCLKTLESSHQKEFSLKKYTDLVVEGGFYEYIQEHFEKLYPSRFNERTKVKKEVLRILYGENAKWCCDFNRPSQTFYQHFPKIAWLFYSIKDIQHNLLPLILQRVESFLILDVVCKNIAVNCPQIPFFTVHDNIITTKGNEGIIKQIMISEIEKWIGHKPSLGCIDLIPTKHQITSEIWKPVIGFEGSYEISESGLVRSLERKVSYASGTRQVKAKQLKTRINNRGYVEVRLSNNGETFTKLVHILSATAFVANPFNKPEVNHLDGNKLNNNYTNFAFVTHAENVQHAYDTGLIKKKAKIIIDKCTGEEFKSSKDASVYHKIEYHTLRGYLNGSIKMNPTCLEYKKIA